MISNIYWAHVQFVDKEGGKRRPVLYIRKTDKTYIVLRLTSKYKNKSEAIQKKYIEIKDWKESNLTKPSWVDTIKIYELPIATTKLEYIGKLSSRDLNELSKHFKLSQ